ncbi:MAG TPA: M1 family aminopeptidase, partial [Prolixibacteraceae bacterium]|nr:M1 family aminopeptidase [Prolixibacteraceae bacterium]
MSYRSFSFISVVLIVLQSITAQAQWERIVSEKKYLYERPDHLFQRSSFTEDETYREWDLTYNRLELKVDPAKWHIEGRVTFVLTSQKDNLNSMTIDLDSSLTVSSVTSGRNPLRYQHSGDNVFINLSNPINKNEVDSFTISYSGAPTTTGQGSFIQSYHNTNPVIFTLSEPTGAKEWWPCKESLSDKIDSIDILVETPSNYLTASNGILVSNNISGTKRVCHWKHRHPIANYLVFFSSTNYDVYTEWATLNDGTKIKVLNYVYPETLEEAKSNTPYTEKYLEFFSQKLIDYPFKDEKYGHAQFGWSGGMEHQTMTSLGMFYPDLIAHELAHQWFGDYITCGNWNEIWLNEGFATYMEGIVYEEF